MNSNIVEEIIQLRKQGISTRKVAEQLKISLTTVKRHCKKNGLIGMLAKTEKDTLEEREREFANKIVQADIGFTYVSGFINQDKPMKIRCNNCSHETIRSGITIRHTFNKSKRILCEMCGKRKFNKSAKQIYKEKQKVHKREISILRKKILKKSKKVKSSLKEVHILKCVECDSLFGSNTKQRRLCSKSCINRRDNRLKELRKRKVRMNGKFDYSITIKKLIQKEKNVCYLCGGQCNSNDFTIDDRGSFIVGRNYPSIEHVTPISKGGTHSWDNVKLAHHYCNSIKNDKDICEDNGQMILML